VQLTIFIVLVTVLLPEILDANSVIEYIPAVANLIETVGELVIGDTVTPELADVEIV
jgi:hypothetical protein